MFIVGSVKVKSPSMVKSFTPWCQINIKHFDVQYTLPMTGTYRSHVMSVCMLLLSTRYNETQIQTRIHEINQINEIR